MNAGYRMTLSDKKTRRFLQFVWAIDVCLVIIVSLLPGRAFPSRLFLSDKILHFLSYVLLAALPILSIERTLIAIMPALSMTILGVLLEYGQIFVQGRSAEFGDVIANTLGVMCGMFIGFVAKHLFA